jgi:DNA-3-methyladenine glycosylase
MPAPLPRSFYARPTLAVARDLLGRVLARRTPDGIVLRGRIVETEAYVGEGDKACHARSGRTPRTDVMYGPPGIAYVYLTYGMHHLLNVVTEPEGSPAAVLLRAVEPLEGLEWMSRARRRFAFHHRRNGTGDGDRSGEIKLHQLASGPGKLCQAYGLDLRHNRSNLLGPELWIEEGERVPKSRIAVSARIGCETATAPWDLMPWRFYLPESRFVTPGRATARG